MAQTAAGDGGLEATRDRARASLADLALAGMLIGSLGGFAELIVLGAVKYGFGRPLWLGPHVLWLTPLLGAFLVACVMAGGWLVVSWRPSAAWRLAMTTGAFVAVWGVLLPVPRLHYLAAAVLAAGIAVRLTQSRAGNRAWIVPRARFLLPRLAVLILLAAGTVGLGRSVLERIQLGRLPVPANDLPNVLLITIDTERAQSLSLYGNRRQTSPVLDSLAGEGTVFERAIAPSPWTLPTHASLFTGREAHELSAGWLTPLDRSDPTLAELLSRAGYATAGFIANTYYGSREFGLARGFLHYEDFVLSFEELLLSSAVLRQVLHLGTVRGAIGFQGILARRSARDINNRFVRWLDGRSARPYFAFLNYFEVHEPYAPSAAFAREYLGGVRRDFSGANHRLRFAGLPDWRRGGLSDSARRVELSAYEGAIATVDREIGNLLQILARRGELNRTVVIITSDHGEQFGERGRRDGGLLFDHGKSLHGEALWVPLYLRYPAKVPSGLKLATPVSLRDIPATIAALSGAFHPAALPGASLSGLWDPAGIASASPVVSTVIPFDRQWEPDSWMASLVTEQYHYIHYGSGEAEVFAHPVDPKERGDLAAELRRSPAGMALLDSLDASLRHALGRWPRSR